MGSVPDLRGLAERVRDSGSVSAGDVGPGWLLPGDEPGILCLAPVYALAANAGQGKEVESSRSSWGI